MSKLRFNISMSLDGYVAGPDQSPENPLGEGGEALHEWALPLKAFREIHGESGGETGTSDDVLRESFENVGAFIMGRNMFGGGPGPWRDDWKGWWGDTPPYHAPVFVLTHHAREPLVMQGGTTFHFVTDGIQSALRQAREAAAPPAPAADSPPNCRRRRAPSPRRPRRAAAPRPAGRRVAA